MHELHASYTDAMAMPVTALFELIDAHTKNNEVI